MPEFLWAAADGCVGEWVRLGATELLIRRFVKDSEHVGDPRVRTAYGRLAGAVGIACNVMLCLGKGAAGLASGSVSIVADALNNLSDASSNVISLLGFKLASKPADRGHPYGHGRYEYLAGLAVAVLVVVIGFGLVRSSLDKIVSPGEPTAYTPVALGTLVASMLVKLWMMAFNRSIGRRIGSGALEAVALDSRNDAVATGAVLAAALVSRFAGVDLDGWAGLAVGAFICVSGAGLVRDSVDPLLGSAPSAEEVRHIREKILSYPGVLGTHDLMVHDYGPGRRFASAHVEMAAEVDPLVSHDVIDNIEQDFLTQDRLVMTIHYDPIVSGDKGLHTLRGWLEELVEGIDARLSVHDVRTTPGPTHTNVIFDCVKPIDVGLTDDELRAEVQRRVSAEHPEYVCRVNVDEDYVPTVR